MATVHLIEGPVGAGKSTFAGRLAYSINAPHLDLDEWMVTLFAPDRPKEDFMSWYLETKHRCIQQIWSTTSAILDCSQDVVLELGLVRAIDREGFYRRVDETSYDLRVHVIDTPRLLRLQRVSKRNEKQTDTYKMTVSEDVFDLADGFWEAPTQSELRQRNIEVIYQT